ncbi:hypothetical protein DFJ74DRAFT_654366 [Hyaloraphidium curvatum]|nr:hypothetical protein DFJ74DRAFT_654366 [Hyaloraphidium curvatum]
MRGPGSPFHSRSRIFHLPSSFSAPSSCAASSSLRFRAAGFWSWDSRTVFSRAYRSTRSSISFFVMLSGFTSAPGSCAVIGVSASVLEESKMRLRLSLIRRNRVRLRGESPSAAAGEEGKGAPVIGFSPREGDPRCGEESDRARREGKGGCSEDGVSRPEGGLGVSARDVSSTRGSRGMRGECRGLSLSRVASVRPCMCSLASRSCRRRFSRSNRALLSLNRAAVRSRWATEAKRRAERSLSTSSSRCSSSRSSSAISSASRRIALSASAASARVRQPASFPASSARARHSSAARCQCAASCSNSSCCSVAVSRYRAKSASSALTSERRNTASPVEDTEPDADCSDGARRRWSAIVARRQTRRGCSTRC